jgi:hypothetical protein
VISRVRSTLWEQDWLRGILAVIIIVACVALGSVWATAAAGFVAGIGCAMLLLRFSVPDNEAEEALASRTFCVHTVILFSVFVTIMIALSGGVAIVTVIVVAIADEYFLVRPLGRRESRKRAESARQSL